MTAPFRWKDGNYRPVSAPDGYSGPRVSAIRNGVVLGGAFGSQNQALRWAPKGIAEPLPGGDYALGLWRGNRAAGELRRPGRYAEWRSSNAGDDGTIFGIASNSPIDEGGVPVLWHLGYPVG